MDPHNASGYANAPGGTTASGHAYSYQSHAPPPPTAGPPTAPAAPQNHQYGYGHGFDNYVYGADQHAQPASQTSAPAQAQPNVPGHAPAPAPAPAPLTPSHFLNHPLPQKLSLSSFSGKKTSAWLKKNVSPRLDNVARSSLVQGSIKELGNAYTAARGMADNYSAKYYAAQAQQQQQFSQHGQHGQHGQHSQHSQTHGSHNTGGHVPWHSPQSVTSPNAAASPAAAQSAALWSHVHDQQAASAPSHTGQPTWASPTPPASTASWGHNHGQQTSSPPPPAGQSTWTLPTPPASTASWSHDHIQQTTSASAAASQPTWTTHTPPASTAPWSQDLHPPHPPAASPAWPQPSQSPGVPAAAVGSSLTDPTSRSAESPSVQPTLPVQPQAVPARRPVQGSISRKPANAPQQTGETIRPVETHDGSTAFLVINHDRKQATRVITSPTGDRTFAEEAYPGPDPPVVEQDNKAAVTYPPVTEVPRENDQWSAPPVMHVQEHHQPAAPTVMQRAREIPVIDPIYDPLALAAPIGTSAGAALRLCPRLRTVSYATTWHHLKGLPDFGICSFCFSKHIGSSPLAHEFDAIVKTKGLCRFNVPRVTKSLWPEAQRTSSVAALRNYVSRRMAIPACTKKGGAVGADGVKWFGLVGGELGMVACEACHEDEVAGTSFAGRFEPLRQVQGASERWICTISYEHVSRCLQIFSARDAWREFVAAAGKRMALPDCSETMGSATSRNWYRPIRPTGDLDICEACYLDSLALTDLGEHFAETGESFEQKLCMRICDLQLMNLSEALVVCRTKGLGIDAFLRAAGKIASSPRCYKKAGITDGRFYNFAGTSAANFGVCEGCHAGILEPHGVAPLFGSKPKLIQGTAWCAFNPSVERFGGLVDHWLEAVETGAWPTYERWVTRYAALPTCPNFNMVAGRRWYGWDDLPMCPECYETVAEGTQLASSFELRDTAVEGERLCSAYTHHMRGRWAEAISAGDVAGLREFNKYRMSVYAQTVPRFKMLAQMQTMQNQLALSQMMLGLSLQHADAISGWGGSSGYEYGNSSLGYHSSQYGVDSAKAFDEGRATMARANGPIAEASYLKDVWQAVE